jgi:hypothetical protein
MVGHDAAWDLVGWDGQILLLLLRSEESMGLVYSLLLLLLGVICSGLGPRCHPT